jgi:ABC-type multidrug transport system fused ATPase/permease subunit
LFTGVGRVTAYGVRVEAGGQLGRPRRDLPPAGLRAVVVGDRVAGDGVGERVEALVVAQVAYVAMEAKQDILCEVVGGVRVADASTDEGTQPAMDVGPEFVRRCAFCGQRHLQLPDVGSVQQVGRSADPQQVRCTAGSQHAAAWSVERGAGGALSDGADSVLISVLWSLIMNGDEREWKWIHGSARLHPFRRCCVLRGMSKLQTPAIEAFDLRKRDRDGTEVLRGVSFAVEPGTISGYLGRSGAGKSTTVRILATLTLPSSGSALVVGIDVQSDLGALAAGTALPLAIAAPRLATPVRMSSRMNRTA